MDNVDDPDLSPIIMIIKFPNIQVLSAKNRKENTNLEVDIKLLQEMLKHGGVKPKSLPIRSINVYHHYMDYEPYISTYQDTWNRLSIHSQVEMDIRQCGYSLTLMQLNNMSISSTDHNINHDDNSTDVTVDECHRIISTNAQCWCCGYHFDKCWKCESLCMGCNSKRLTPSANDIQIKIKSQRHKTHTHLIADEEDFSVFE
ncbi:hypothetical protein BDB01DRAFT_724378 [Pilobolus umbonatus]|nr:hypothetical protein BDB01DRAFT_724378 [Pilobolus umbonatus]